MYFLFLSFLATEPFKNVLMLFQWQPVNGQRNLRYLSYYTSAPHLLCSLCFTEDVKVWSNLQQLKPVILSEKNKQQKLHHYCWRTSEGVSYSAFALTILLCISHHQIQTMVYQIMFIRVDCSSIHYNRFS